VPFLRVLRDKRGYETTYLMHWFREGSRQRSRSLYVFRTPPGVKVGRDPIDSAVIREIEAQHPDIEFDWRALRENQQVIDTSPEPRRPRKPRRDEKERPPVEKAASDRGRPEAPPPPSPVIEPPAPQLPPPPRLVVPPAIEGTTREEQFVFLLKWYLQLRERVPHRTQDPIRREALRALVERLNPEAWVGEEAIVEGLKHAAEALQRLSTLFAKRRKRPRRPKSDRAEALSSTEGGDASEPGPADAVRVDLPDAEPSGPESDRTE
jgi:hypothetical protein